MAATISVEFRPGGQMGAQGAWPSFCSRRCPLRATWFPGFLWPRSWRIREVRWRGTGLRRREDDVLIGFIALIAIEWGNRTGKVAMGIGRAEDRGQGYGFEAMTLMLHFAFGELNLHRVGLDVIETNAAAIRLYERAGFHREGRIAEAVWRDGARCDVLLMGILARDWLSRGM